MLDEDAQFLRRPEHGAAGGVGYGSDELHGGILDGAGRAQRRQRFGCGTLAAKSGVALRLPPQSRTTSIFPAFRP